MAETNIIPKPTRPSSGSGTTGTAPRKVRVPLTRAQQEAQWAKRATMIGKIINRQTGKLVRLGGARVEPSREQVTRFQAWLREQTETACEALEARFREQAVTAKAPTFDIGLGASIENK